MTSIKLTVTGAQAWASVTGPLTSGMVGIPVTIEYDEAWDGLTKNLMCRCSPWGSNEGENRAILNVGENAIVAHEVMQPGMYLYLGVEGFRSDGTLVIPTTWARCGKIEYGANTCEDPSTNPELSVWNQLQTEMEQLKEYTLTQEQVAEIQACAQEAAQAADEAKQAADEAKQAAENIEGSGLYYTPVVTQPTNDTLKFEFKPSVTGAPIPKPITVELPVSENSGQDPNYSTLASPYSGKTANFLGDSITALNTVNASKPYHAWVAELLGVTVNNYGLNGSSFADNNSSAKAFYERYESMAQADLVVVAGGINDTLHGSALGAMGDATTETVYGALDVLCQGLRKKYPVADIVFLTPTEWVNSKELSVAEVADAVVSVCKKYAIPVYDNRTFSGIYPTESANKNMYLSDTIHWNDTAHEKAGKELSSFLLQLKGYPGYHFVKAAQTEYSVINKLTNVTSSNQTAVVSAGDSYTATLTADDGYVLGGVSVTMSGADVTASVYTSGVITIDHVTGNLVISAAASAHPSNLVYPYPDLKDSYSLGLLDTYCYVLVDPLPAGIIKTMELRMKSAETLKCYLATHDTENKSVTITNQFAVDGTTSFTEHNLSIPVTDTNTVLIVNGNLARTRDETSESGGFEYNYFSTPETGVAVGETYDFGRAGNGADMAFALRLGIEPA